MLLAKPVRGLTALALILAAGMAVADEGDGTVTEAWPADEAPVDELPVDEPPGDGDPGIVIDDGWVTIDFGCIDCNLPPDEGATEGGADEDGEDWTDEEDWSEEEDWTAEDGEDGTGEDWTEEEGWTEDPDPSDPLEYVPVNDVVDDGTGTPRAGDDGVIAPNERDPLAQPTMGCGGCEAEGGLMPLGNDRDRTARQPVVEGNICTDPVTYAAWLCEWQGYPRP